jgi:type I restriction enzyme R subunit
LEVKIRIPIYPYRTLTRYDRDRVTHPLTEDIPNRVAAGVAYQNAMTNFDNPNARLEHDEALGRVITAGMRDDTEQFRQFMDNESFRRGMTAMVFGLTYEPASASD